MTEIIYGFIISGFFVLSGCFIRLGLILQELEKKNDGNNQNNDFIQGPGGK